MRAASEPILSVVTPYDGSSKLGAFLASLASQTLNSRAWELIVGCHRSRQPCAGEATGLPFSVTTAITDDPPSHEYHSAALLRNAAIGEARGVRVVFVDSDCLLSPWCLERHALAGECTALCGPRRELIRTCRQWRENATDYASLRSLSLPDWRDTRAMPILGRADWEDFWTCNASAPLGMVRRAGLFDERGFRCHDLDLAYRLCLLNARVVYDPLCEVLHIGHARSIWARRNQIGGLKWLAKRHPAVEYAAENLVAVFREAFKTTLIGCERKLKEISRKIPGVRAGFSLVAPCGYDSSAASEAIAGIPTIVRGDEHGVRIFLRLDETCWDYSIVFPKASAVMEPRFSIVIPAGHDEIQVARTVESILCQTVQSFEIVLTATADTALFLRRAVAFASCGRLRVRLRSGQPEDDDLERNILPSCRGGYAIVLRPGTWLPENALADLRNGLSRDNSGFTEIQFEDPFPRFSATTRGVPQNGESKADSGGLITVRCQSLSAFRASNPGESQSAARSKESSGNASVCAFTFDGGPHPVLTHDILDALNEAGFKATFFLLGAKLRNYPEVTRRIAAEGHDLGIQGMFREDLSFRSFPAVADSLHEAKELLEDTIGWTPRWFRPPFGASNALVREVCRREDLRAAGWNLSSEDWTGQDFRKTVSAVLSGNIHGNIVLFHDGCGDPLQTARALRALGTCLAGHRISSLTLSEMERSFEIPESCGIKPPACRTSKLSEVELRK